MFENESRFVPINNRSRFSLKTDLRSSFLIGSLQLIPRNFADDSVKKAPDLLVIKVETSLLIPPRHDMMSMSLSRIKKGDYSQKFVSHLKSPSSCLQ